MTRQPRADEPGAVHHAWFHALDELAMFVDDVDRRAWLSIVRYAVRKTHTRVLAWALMDNHAHLLLETGDVPISRVVQRLASMYARAFNARHRRRGRVYRCRYGSRRVQADEYLVKVIAYVLVNPIGAPAARSAAELETYPWTAYAELMGRRRDGLVDVEGVLAVYGRDVASARACLRAAVEEESQAPGDDGLRSVLRLTTRASLDEPLLGVVTIEGRRAFLDRVTRDWASRSARRAALYARGWRLGHLVAHVCNLLDADQVAVSRGRKTRRELKARAAIAYLACDLVGERGTDVARATGVSPSAIVAARLRGADVLRRANLAPEFVIGASCGPSVDG